jgi:hypothetical protein
VVVAVLVAGTGSAWALTRIDPGTDADRDSLSAEEPDPTASATSGRPSAPASVSPIPPDVSPATPGRRAAHKPEPPVRVRLPSGASVRVRAVTTRSDGVLDVPDDIRVAGWWRGGSRIGDPFGATLIAAHIDSRVQGLGPYAELLRVEPRALIVVRSTHQRQVFRVTSLRVVPRNSLAGVTELFSVSGPRRLVMVTCAGPFDPDEGGYQNLAVVTARATSA